MVQTELQALLQQAAQIVPGLNGTLGAPPVEGIRPGADNSAQIAALRHWWASRHPEAGAHYLALRCWGLLIWQPVYLSVIASHCSPVVPRLAQLSQPVVNGFISGYAMEPHTPWRGNLDERIDIAAAQLREVCGALHTALGAQLRLHPRATRSLQAGCVLHAVLAVRQHGDGLSNRWARDTAGLWLERLGLDGLCSYQAYLKAGTQILSVAPQVCCHHFRRCDGCHCDNCPKLDATERASRLGALPIDAACETS